MIKMPENIKYLINKFSLSPIKLLSLIFLKELIFIIEIIPRKKHIQIAEIGSTITTNKNITKIATLSLIRSVILNR